MSDKVDRQAHWEKVYQTKAADYFAKAVAANGLDNDSHFNTMYNLAVIQYGNDKYAEALATIHAAAEAMRDVLTPEQRAQWAAIADAADAARRAGVARIFVWALPQVARDGFVTFDGEDAVQAFDAVDFPLAIGREAMVATEFSTQIVSSPSGHEQRASEWAEARMRYDAGPGIRSEADVRALTDITPASPGRW